MPVIGHRVRTNSSRQRQLGNACRARGWICVIGCSPGLVLSFSVLADNTKSRQATLEKSRATLSLLNNSLLINDNEIDVRGDQLGPGYGVPTESMLEAVRLIASSEG